MKLISGIIVALAISLFPMVAVSADGISDGVCKGLNIFSDPDFDACGTEIANGNDDPTLIITNLSSTIVNLFSVAIGAIAVVMLIYGGFRYITSAGSQERVQGAKNTILYAVIGLLIVIFAQTIIRFVVGTFSDIA